MYPYNRHWPYLVAHCLLHRLIRITEAMKEPRKFPPVELMHGFHCGLLTGFGVMGYMTYGSNDQTVVIVTLPRDTFVKAVLPFLKPEEKRLEEHQFAS
jgi:hypothetical protein